MQKLSDLLADAVQLRGEYFIDGLEFGESPRYYDGKLYVSDMMGRRVYSIHPQTGRKEVVVEVPECANGMGFLKDGSLIYSSMFDRKLHRLTGNVSELYVDLSPLMTGYPGDLVVDQSDRIYVDDVGFRALHGESRKPGRVIIVETDRSLRAAAEGTAFPNGIAIDSTQSYLFLSASTTQTLHAYNIGSDGNLTNGRVILDLGSFPDSKERTACDGLCIDAEDGLWLSLLDFEVFVRRDRHSNFTHVVQTHGHATACALGGDDGKTLFMVTNTVPEGNTLFRAMANRLTTDSIATCRVSVGRGLGRP